MKRYVIVPIDNDDVTDIGVVELDMDSGTTSRGLYHLFAPPDEQLTRDLEKITAMYIDYYLEFAEELTDPRDRGGDVRFALARGARALAEVARAEAIRAAFGLDDE